MQPPDAQSAYQALYLILLACWASVAVWSWMAHRWVHRQTVLPFERRPTVPWGGVEAVTILGLFFLAPLMVGFAGMQVFDLEVPESPGQADALQLAHQVERLIRQGGPGVVLLAALMAVVVAPVVEEFVFRLVFQGWLEKAERRLCRTSRLRLGWMTGAAPIATSSLLFAAMHYREPEALGTVKWLVFLLACQAVGNLLTLAVGLFVLRAGCRATAADLGFSREHLGRDLWLGLVACLAVTGPVYVMNIAARAAVGKEVAADPVPLFFLSLVLGILYLRTHRIVPAIVLHAAFNGSGLLLFALTR